jgi:crossover junction endodeoxyribonuclease RuvC
LTMNRAEAGDLRVLGVDPGLRVTGWAILSAQGQRLRLLDCGTIATDARSPLAKRLLCIYDGLAEVLMRWRPWEVAVEEPFVAGNRRSAMALGEARAAALLAAAAEGLPVCQYPPAEVKQLVTGHGRSDKSQVQAMLCMQLGLAEPPASADEADALAVALCHLLRRRGDMLVESREEQK